MTDVCTTSLQKTHKFQAFREKLDKQKDPFKLIVVVEAQHLDSVQSDENFQWRNQSLLLPESRVMEAREATATTHAHLNPQMHRV